MLHCDGKCYLAKQLKKLEQDPDNYREKKNQPVPKLPLKLKENVWNSDSQVIAAFEANILELLSEKTTAFFYQNTELNSFSGSVFHPPILG